MTMAMPDVSAPPDWRTDWKAIDWKIVRAKVMRLQVRIAKAVREKRWGKVAVLQRILVMSRYARLLAVRRVTTNNGKRTPGVDGVIWNTPRKKMQAVSELKRRGYKPLPLRRTYVPKRSGKRRPLGIPTFKDRAMQALYKLALEPVAETLADRNSYGFRLSRSTADALGQCFILLAKKDSPTWIWEADIAACFDNFDHDWMLKNIPMDKSMLRKWLKAGYMEGGTLYPTEKGTPQGGLISPVLANMVLDGLEDVSRNAVPKRVKRRSTRSKVNVVRYADDSITTAHSKELLEDRVIPAVVQFLDERGLKISEEKSKITHITEGFEFLGAHIRKYENGKLLMTPSKANVKGFLEDIRSYIRDHPCMKPEHLIHQLNRRLRGWANYFRPLVSSRTFQYVDSRIFTFLWRWARRRHRRKGARWVYSRYFRELPDGSRPFSAATRAKTGQRRNVVLFHASWLTIRRHVKVQSEAHPFDPEYDEYYRERKARQRRDRRQDFCRGRERKQGQQEQEKAA